MPPLGVASQIIAIKTDRVQNVGSGSTDLLQVRLPPNILRNIGDCIRITAAMFMAANGNAKTDNIFFGSLNCGGRTSADNNLPRMDEVWIVKRGQNLQSSVLENHANGQASLTLLADGTENENSPILVKLAAVGVATGDIESRLLIVEYIPATSVFGF